MKKQIKLKETSDYVDVYIPLTSQGKFRCKYRNSFQEYGKGFAPKSNIIPENVYLEWQIGYDVPVKEKGVNTILNHLTFIGANKVQKNPYELSEIVYLLCKKGIIKKHDLEEMITKIENIHNFFQEKFSIDTKVEDMLKINDEDFYKSVITLPTLNKVNKSCSIVTQISIEKQQYATGIQPMLYLTIPVNEFENKDLIIGNTSKKEEYGILRIDKKKKDVIENAILCFGMCSIRHHHDILAILNLIKNNI